MKNRVWAACAALLFAAALPSGAKAASVNVDVDITLPQVLLLYCYSDVSVTVPGAALANLGATSLSLTAGTNGVEAGDSSLLGSTSQTATNSSGTTLDVNLSASGVSDGSGFSTATLNLNNVCAVRGLASSNVAVSVDAASDTVLTGPGTGNTITVNSYTPSPTSTAVTLGSATQIDVALALNLSSVNGPGNFAMAGSNKMIVTATLP